MKISNPWEVMVRRFLFIIFLFLPGVGYTLPHANERVIDYSLEVPFNVQASKINGIATIPIKEGEAINLDKGKLNLLM